MRDPRIAYMVFSPLCGGWLTGKYGRDQGFPDGSRMTQRPEPYEHLLNERTFDALDALKAFARPPRDLDGRRRARVAARRRAHRPGRDRARPSRTSRAAARGDRAAAYARRTRRSGGYVPTMSVLILNHDDVHAALEPEACERAMAAVLTAHGRGEAYFPLRSVMIAPGAPGFMGLMPAYSGGTGDGDPGVFALKAICLMRGNPARGLDAHQGIVTLFDHDTGVPTAVINASAVTEIRTAAVTAVATRALSREGSTVLAILGAGVQAKAHLRALRGMRDWREVRVYAPDRRARAGRRRLASRARRWRRAGARRSRAPTWSSSRRARASRCSSTPGWRRARTSTRSARANPSSRDPGRDGRRRGAVLRQPRVAAQRGRRVHARDQGGGDLRRGSRPGRARRAAGRQGAGSQPTTRS